MEFRAKHSNAIGRILSHAHASSHREKMTSPLDSRAKEVHQNWPIVASMLDGRRRIFEATCNAVSAGTPI